MLNGPPVCRTCCISKAKQMTSRSPTSRLLEISPLRDVVLKQLDMKAALNIKSLAKLFEDGGGQGLLDYRHPSPRTFSCSQPSSSKLPAAQCRTCLPRRASNLLEDNTAARRVFQEALTQMPDELRLLASLLSTAQVRRVCCGLWSTRHVELRSLLLVDRSCVRLHKIYLDTPCQVFTSPCQSMAVPAQELCDRVAGRNSEDAETIVAGLRELLTQWTAREAAVKAALAEARHGADDALVAALETAACERGQHLAQIAALEAKLKATKQQVGLLRCWGITWVGGTRIVTVGCRTAEC